MIGYPTNGSWYWFLTYKHCDRVLGVRMDIRREYMQLQLYSVVAVGLILNFSALY
jgi:hypothetical protein